MFFTIDGILLLKKGVAEKTYAREGGKFVSDFMKDALDAGVKFVRLHGRHRAPRPHAVATSSTASRWSAGRRCCSGPPRAAPF